MSTTDTSSPFFIECLIKCLTHLIPLNNFRWVIIGKDLRNNEKLEFLNTIENIIENMDI